MHEKKITNNDFSSIGIEIHTFWLNRIQTLNAVSNKILRFCGKSEMRDKYKLQSIVHKYTFMYFLFMQYAC